MLAVEQATPGARVWQDSVTYSIVDIHDTLHVLGETLRLCKELGRAIEPHIGRGNRNRSKRAADQVLRHDDNDDTRKHEERMLKH
jgi:hypothetical protein